MAPSHAAAVVPEPVSPELALVDPVLRGRLLTALSQTPVEVMPAQAFAPPVPSKNRAAGRRAQERLGYLVAAVALTIGCALGLSLTLPHRGTTNARPPAPIADSTGEAGQIVTWSPTPPAVAAPAKHDGPSKAPVRLDPFLPPDPPDALPPATSNAR